MGGRLRILIIDDDPGDRLLLAESLKLALEPGSFELVEVSDFDQGLNALSLESVDVCFLDYRLGGRSGLELLEAAQQRRILVPTIMLTGLGDEDLAVQALKAGAVDYLRKGLLTPELAAKAVDHARGVHERECERISMMEALKRETRFSSTVLNNSFDGIGVVGQSGKIRYMNPALMELFGLSGEPPQKLDELDGGIDASASQVEALKAYLKEALRRGIGPEKVLPFTGRSGRRWRRLRLSPMPGAEFILNVQDVTAQRERELRLVAYKRRLEEDLRAAAAIQSSLLPDGSLQAENIRYGWAFHPAQAIGGDILNIYSLPGGRGGLYLIDVMGHGVSAAMLATTIHNFLHNDRSRLVQRNCGEVRIIPPGELLGTLNVHFPFNRFERYFTIACMVLDSRSGELSYANAGHTTPLRISADGSVAPLDGRGPFVGLETHTSYGTNSCFLAAGDKVVLFSDGVVEMSDARGQFFGQERLLKVLTDNVGTSPQELVEALMGELAAFSGMANARDDISLLCVEYAPSA
jgi:sigma-B regulation protein RsbU (phosphoserine phosphatase)